MSDRNLSSLRFIGCSPRTSTLCTKIVEPLEKKPWGLRQFTIEDLDENRFYFHGD